MDDDVGPSTTFEFPTRKIVEEIKILNIHPIILSIVNGKPKK